MFPIRRQALLTGLFGAMLGTALGLPLGVLLLQLLADEGLTALAVTWRQVALTLRLDVILAMGSA
ncbi:MAG: hypothetical protein ACRC0L_07870 [Angustibacter sp.]